MDWKQRYEIERAKRIARIRNAEEAAGPRPWASSKTTVEDGPPLVHGGQGRTASAVTEAASATAFTLALGLLTILAAFCSGGAP